MSLPKIATRIKSELSVKGKDVLVESTHFFPSDGYLKIGSEYVYFSVKTPTSFHLDSRGLRGSTQKPHTKGTTVILVDEVNPILDTYAGIYDKIGSEIFIDSQGEMTINEIGDVETVTGLGALDLRLRLRINSVLGVGADETFGLSTAGLYQGDEAIAASQIAEILEADPNVDRVGEISYEIVDGLLHVAVIVFVTGMQEAHKLVYKVSYNRKMGNA